MGAGGSAVKSATRQAASIEELAGGLEEGSADEQLAAVLALVDRFGWRGIEPFELFTSEFGQNSGTSAKKLKKFRNVRHCYIF